MAFDALVHALHTSCLPFFHMGGVRAAMRKVIVVADPHLFGIHAAVAFEAVRHQNSVCLLLVLALALRIAARRRGLVTIVLLGSLRCL